MGTTFQGSTYKSAAKVTILKEYADIYTDILGSKWPEELWYIETHAGSGVINTGNGEIDGSTITMLSNYADEFDGFYFYEEDEDHFDELVARLEGRFGWSFDVGPAKPDDADFKVARLEDPYIRIMNVDCNDGAPFLIEHSYEERHWLVFIDQAGPTVHMDTVDGFLDRGHMDLLLTFPTRGIHRAAGSDHSKHVVDDHYRGKWTEDADLDQRVDEFVDLIEERPEYKPVIDRPLQWQHTHQARFDLIFASASSTAREKAEDRMQQDDIWVKANERLGNPNLNSWT